MTKSKKDLAEYLANYLDHELHQSITASEFSRYWKILKQGLETFESTENVRIEVWPIKAETE